MIQKKNKKTDTTLQYLLSYRQITRLGFYGMTFFLTRIVLESIETLTEIKELQTLEESILIVKIILIPTFVVFLMYKSNY